jgi:hypothetical protein
MKIEKDENPGEYIARLESAEINVLLNWARSCRAGRCEAMDCKACDYIENIINELERAVTTIDNSIDERLIMLEKFEYLQTGHPPKYDDLF